MYMITEQCTKGLEDNPEACRIRQAVFVDEQGFHNEFDEIDPEAWHVVLWEDGAALATGRVFPKQDSDGVWTIGRVAVLKPYRGKGLGALVVQKLEQVAAQHGAKAFILSAQVRAQGFYEAIGYHAKGETYLDEYCPHVTMTKPAGEENQEEQS